MILRVPGIGLLSAQKIVSARKFAQLSWEQLKKIGVAINRARYFIICKSNEFERRDLSGNNIKQFILAESKSKYIKNTQTQFKPVLIMYTLVYDGTFEGLLTAVFEIYERKLLHVKLIKGERRTNALFEEVLQIITDEDRANRVLKGLRKKLSTAGVQKLYIAHMAEMEDEESAIIGFIRYVFDTTKT
jgi:hypothetical protein